MLIFKNLFLGLIGIFLGSTLWSQHDLSRYLPSDFELMDYDQKYSVLDSMRKGGERPYEINIGLALKGWELAREEGDLSGAALWTKMASRLYGNLGLYNEAENYALISLENARQDKNIEYESSALLRLGRTKMDLNQFDEALEFVNEGIEKAKLIGDHDQEGLGWAWNMKGEIYRMAGMFDESLASYGEAMSDFEKNKVGAGIDAVSHNMGLSQASAGNFAEARRLLNTEMDSYIAYDPARKMEYFIGMVDVLVGSDSLEKGIAMAQSGIEFANSIDSKRWEIEILNKLAGLERKREHWDRAWDLREQANSLSEEVLGERVRMQSEVMGVRFDLNQVEAENKLLVETNRNQQLLTRGLIAIGILSLLIVSIVVFNFLKARKYNQDLTQRNDQLDGLIQEKDILMNIMAHDLKAPLHAIGGMMELIRDPETPQALKESCIDKVQIALDRESNLISNLLGMAAVESGDVGVNLGATSLSEVIQRSLQDNLTPAHHKEITLHYEGGEDITVHTDPVLAGRILNNFLSNAIKYSPLGKAVHVRVVEQAHRIAIQVQDEGPGLSSVDQSKLFQKFKTLSARPTGGESSTGLGLALAWALAEKIQGTISVDSDLGKGAVFSLTLPKSPLA